MSKKRSKYIWVAFCLFHSVHVHAASNTLTLKGSDTMLILGQRWAEEFTKKNKGTVVQVTGGGSDTGIAALINGSTDIAEASRPMKDSEKELIQKQQGKTVEEIAVALEGINIYVNQGNPVTEFAIHQLKAIYTCEINDWKAIGSTLGKVIAYGRETNSGTYADFKERILNGQDCCAEVVSLPNNAAVINAVSKDRRAIGYGDGIANAKSVKIVPLKTDDANDAIAPTMENIVTGKYPLSRKLFFYTLGKPEGTTKEFITWILSPEGQKICQSVGYYPLVRTTSEKSLPERGKGSGPGPAAVPPTH